MTKEMCVNGCWWLRMYSGVMIISIAMVSWAEAMASTATRAGRWRKISRIGRPGPLAAAGCRAGPPHGRPQDRRPPPSPAVHHLAPDEGGEGRAEEVERRGHARPRHPSAEFRADNGDDGEDGDRGRRARALRDKER